MEKKYSIEDNDGIYWFSKEPVEFVEKFKVLFKDGEIVDYTKYLHRKDGPAVEYTNGDREWYVNGRRHGGDGPAVEWKENNEKYWYWHGKYLKNVNSQEEFKEWKRFKNFR